MSKSPVVNALAAVLYICAVAFIMFYGTQNLPKEDSIFAPIAFISLFTLSAAMMGFIFFYQPVQLYLDGKKKIALNLFLHTLLSFAIITVVFLALFFSRIIK